MPKSSYENMEYIRLSLKASGKRGLWQLLQLEQLILDLLTSVVYFILCNYFVFHHLCAWPFIFVIFKNFKTSIELQVFMEPDLKTNKPKWLLHSEPPDEHVYEANGVGIMQKKGDEVVI